MHFVNLKKACLSQTDLVIIYCSFARSTVEYAAPAWSNFYQLYTCNEAYWMKNYPEMRNIPRAEPEGYFIPKGNFYRIPRDAGI